MATALARETSCPMRRCRGSLRKRSSGFRVRPCRRSPPWHVIGAAVALASHDKAASLGSRRVDSGLALQHIVAMQRNLSTSTSISTIARQVHNCEYNFVDAWTSAASFQVSATCQIFIQRKSWCSTHRRTKRSHFISARKDCSENTNVGDMNMHYCTISICIRCGN